MTDLDTGLRSMLRERAGDIGTMPVDFLDLPSLDLLDHDPIEDVRDARRTPWLIAAAVVAVLAVGGTSLGIALGSRHSGTNPGPTAAGGPSGHPPSVAPTATSRGPSSDVPLTWFGLDDLPGYTVPLRQNDPGIRMAALRRTGDTGAPVGGNGGLSSSDQVLVFDRGRFDASGSGALAGTRATVGASQGWFAATPRYITPSAKGSDVPTLAWEYAPDSWAIVQSLTDATARATDLERLAEAVHPDVAVPIDLPFRLAGPPSGTITEIFDNRPGGYSMSVRFEAAATRRSTDLTWSPSPVLSGRDGAPARSIGGLEGYQSPTGGAGVVYHGGNLTIGVVNGEGQATAAENAVLTTLLDGLTWVNGDGSGPGIPITSAIP